MDAGRVEEGRGLLRTARVALERGGDAAGALDADAELRRAAALEAERLAAAVEEGVARAEELAGLLQRAVALGAAGDWAARVGRAG